MIWSVHVLCRSETYGTKTSKDWKRSLCLSFCLSICAHNLNVFKISYEMWTGRRIAKLSCMELRTNEEILKIVEEYIILTRNRFPPTHYNLKKNGGEKTRGISR